MRYDLSGFTEAHCYIGSLAANLAAGAPISLRSFNNKMAWCVVLGTFTKACSLTEYRMSSTKPFRLLWTSYRTLLPPLELPPTSPLRDLCPNVRRTLHARGRP